MRLTIFFAFIVIYIPVKAQEQPEYTSFNLGLNKISTTISVDGILDEEAWEGASVTSEFLNKWPRDEGYAVNQIGRAHV